MPIVMDHVGHHTIKIVINIFLRAITHYVSQIYMCKMKRETRMGHTSTVGVGVGISLNNWWGAEMLVSSSTHSLLPCSISDSPPRRGEVQVMVGGITSSGGMDEIFSNVKHDVSKQDDARVWGMAP
jgi:hypothetical protein